MSDSPLLGSIVLAGFIALPIIGYNHLSKPKPEPMRPLPTVHPDKVLYESGYLEYDFSVSDTETEQIDGDYVHLDGEPDKLKCTFIREELEQFQKNRALSTDEIGVNLHLYNSLLLGKRGYQIEIPVSTENLAKLGVSLSFNGESLGHDTEFDVQGGKQTLRFSLDDLLDSDERYKNSRILWIDLWAKPQYMQGPIATLHIYDMRVRKVSK